MPAAAARLQNFPPYPFAVLNQRVRALQAAGCDVISLDVGSPDQPPAQSVIETLAEAAFDPAAHGYSGYRGTAGFRRAVAAYYEARFGVSLDPDREVLPLMGSKEGIVNLSLAYLDRGDISLMGDISYPAYAMGARMAGAQIAWLPTPEADHFRPDWRAVAPDVLGRAKLLWLNFPGNPTGAIAEPGYLADAVRFASAHDILLVHDNPYVDVTYDGYIAPSILQVPGAKAHAVEFISCSKTYNMAGWRLGAAVGSAAALDNLLQVKSNLDSGHFNAVYEAGIAAMTTTTPEWLNARNAVYARRRDRIMAALPRLGLSAHTPQGALYIWAKTETGDGAAYAERALTEAHVSLAPGSIYGPGGTAYVRLSLCTPDARTEEALARLEKWWSAQ